MWEAYWGLRGDPFRGPGSGSAYVPTPVHEEAVARLLHAIEAPGPVGVVRGGAGLGKSTVLGRAASLARGPGRRVVRLVPTPEPDDLPRALAGALRPGRGWVEGGSAWRSLGEALAVARLQRTRVALVLDDADDALAGPARRDLERLARLAPASGVALAVVLAASGDDPDALLDRGWRARLAPLDATTAAAYLRAKLAAAGRAEPAFDAEAEVELYDRSGGVPEVLDRLATLALMAGALDRARRVGRGVVAGVADEFAAPSRSAAG